MTQLASKTPRDLNRDKAPWVHTSSPEHRFYVPEPADYDGTALIVEGEDAGQWTEWGGPGCVYDPRPEYDHVQHNDSNIVLEDFRRALAGKDPVHTYWPPEHVTHAVGVLARLAKAAA
jgi:hypothetical protein